jgi:hypothetical protein
MGQSLSPAARELHAEHCSIIASLTQDQKAALEREALAKNAANFNGGNWRQVLAEMFERLAARP